MMQNKTILIVDRDLQQARTLQPILQEYGYQLLTADEGILAMKLLQETKIHLVISEIFLPDMSGEQLCRCIRRESDVPIIILTAKEDVMYMLEAVTWGADDYLIKPIDSHVLFAKIQFVLKRSSVIQPVGITVIQDRMGELIIDLNRRIVEKSGKEIRLTPTEYKILTIMAKAPNRVFTRGQLITYALEEEFHGYDRSIDTYIKGLRQKIETDRSNPQYIRTVHGFGYKFVP
jgi:DNA-binding response OmpR family regulator